MSIRACVLSGAVDHADNERLDLKPLELPAEFFLATRGRPRFRMVGPPGLEPGTDGLKEPEEPEE